MTGLEEVTAGTPLGTAGGTGIWGLDWRLTDTRVTPLPFVNPSRYRDDSLHIACAVDYFDSATKSDLSAMFGARGQPRTALPLCGTSQQDHANTLEGNWFASQTGLAYPEDPNLALVHDNVDPSQGVISVGNSLMPELNPGTFSFTPNTDTSSHANVDFPQVTDTSAIYCYETQTFGNSPNLVFLMQLVDSNTMNIAYVSAVHACSDLTTPWSFNGLTVHTFYR
jgi:hypothetical protein